MKSILTFFFLLFVTTAFTQSWDSLGGGTSHAVRYLYTDSTTNDLYVSGNFLLAGSDTVSCITRWDGSQWNKMDKGAFRGQPTSGCNPIFSITKYNNNIYAAGQFFGPYRSIAKWNGISWDSITTLQSGGISYMTEHQGELYVMGVFTQIDTINAWGIAKWNGQKWSAIDTTTWYGHGIYTMAFYKGELYIGGNFRSHDYSIQDLAKWNGTTWESVSNFPFNGMSAGVFKLEKYKGRLYIGGSFEKPDFPGNNLMAWDGNEWDDLGGGMRDFSFDAGGHVVYDLLVHQNKLYVVGGFYRAGLVEAQRIAIWDDTQWCGLGSTIFNTINTITTYKDSIVIGVGYGLIDSVNYNHIAMWTGGNYTDTCKEVITTTLHTDITEEKILLYPNPVQEILNIDLSELTFREVTLSISIYNNLGQRVRTEVVNNNRMRVATSNLVRGIYYLTIHHEGKMYSVKFIKQ